MPEQGSETPRPDEDLRDHLHQMETRVRKLRESRNNHNEQANRFADQRNAIQGQYKEHKEKLDLSLAEIKAIRATEKQKPSLWNSMCGKIYTDKSTGTHFLEPII